MNYKVVDNFLEENEFKYLQNLIVSNDGDRRDFPWKITTDVASETINKDYNSKIEKQLWNWYAMHPIYHTVPESPYYDDIFNIFKDKWYLKSLIRIKVNFYPYTNEIKEHAKHQDYDFSHHGAVFSLNTCDGFTRMSNGDKIDSVANRIVFFDASEYHNSSTTSNQKGRYNINFNYF